MLFAGFLAVLQLASAILQLLAHRRQVLLELNHLPFDLSPRFFEHDSPFPFNLEVLLSVSLLQTHVVVPLGQLRNGLLQRVDLFALQLDSLRALLQPAQLLLGLLLEVADSLQRDAVLISQVVQQLVSTLNLSLQF